MRVKKRGGSHRKRVALAGMTAIASAALFAPLLVPATPTAKVLFGGDMMFDRYIRIVMEQRGEDFILSCMKDRLRDADLVVANLEGPITDAPSVSATSTVGDPYNMTFTFPPSTASFLKEQGVGLVDLGNNHILNLGYKGYRATRSYLDKAGVGYFGDVPGDVTVADKEIRGIHLTFISFNQFGGSAKEAIRRVREAREAGELPVVFAHWGEEYEAATESQKELAHEFVDAGAELVVGAHPHVAQEHEVYDGKYIYYSLGNFIFDQYWEENVRRGLLIEVSFTANGVSSVREMSVELERDGRTCPL